MITASRTTGGRDGEGGTEIAALTQGAQLVVCAARAARRPGQVSPCALFRAAGVGPEGLMAFTALLGLLFAAGEAAPRLERLHAPTLSADEERLVSAIGALQSGAPWLAQRVVASWLPQAAAPRAVGLMAASAHGLARAGLAVSPEARRPTVH